MKSINFHKRSDRKTKQNGFLSVELVLVLLVAAVFTVAVLKRTNAGEKVGNADNYLQHIIAMDKLVKQVAPNYGTADLTKDIVRNGGDFGYWDITDAGTPAAVVVVKNKNGGVGAIIGNTNNYINRQDGVDAKECSKTLVALPNNFSQVQIGTTAAIPVPISLSQANTVCYSNNGGLVQVNVYSVG